MGSYFDIYDDHIICRNSWLSTDYIVPYSAIDAFNIKKETLLTYPAVDIIFKSSQGETQDVFVSWERKNNESAWRAVEYINQKLHALSAEQTAPNPPAIAAPQGGQTEAWICPNCGTQGVTSQFCPNCGTKRPSQTWTCPQCGTADLKSGFCPNCGHPRQ